MAHLALLALAAAGCVAAGAAPDAPSPPEAPCEGQFATGQLEGPGDLEAFSLVDYTGAQRGVLTSRDAADFDLYLYAWGPGGWEAIDASTRGGANEGLMTASLLPRDYRWEVISHRGAGDFAFCLALW